jgi:hypothetical protein
MRVRRLFSVIEEPVCGIITVQILIEVTKQLRVLTGERQEMKKNEDAYFVQGGAGVWKNHIHRRAWS